MRFMIIVKATKDSEPGVMPEEKLIAAMAIVWGRHDPFFTVAGARAYKRDIPDAELHLLDAGHFTLETHGSEIAALIRDFLCRRIDKH